MKSNRYFTAAAIALGALGTLANRASAFVDNIVVDTWYSASFGDNGSAVSGPPFSDSTGAITSIDAPVAPFTITLGAPATLVVVDVEISGDHFEMFDFGSSIGTTSIPVPNASGVDNDIAAALADSNFSRGYFPLSAGTHELTGILLPDSITFGDVGFIVTTESVPEPASLGLLGLGVVGLLARRRRA